MNKIANILFLFFTAFVLAQLPDSIPEENDTIIGYTSKHFLIKNGKAVPFMLSEARLFPPHKFKDKIDKSYYKWFRKKVFKAYPYAIIASNKLDSLNAELSKIQSKRKKRKLVKKVQKYVEEEFTDQLKKLTRTEGRILINLVHRQTSKTAYQNIKELRSGFRAFFYNAQASLFSISLKDEYNPNEQNEDYLIEDVLQRAFLYGDLEEEEPKLDFNGKEFIHKRNGQVDVEKYKKMFSKRKKRKKHKNKK